MSKAECDANEVLKLQAKVERLEAEAAALRGALETVEWVYHTGAGYCHWCERTFKSGHAPDCQRQLALAADARRGPLERLRRAERKHDEARVAFDALARAGEIAAGNVARDNDLQAARASLERHENADAANHQAE